MGYQALLFCPDEKTARTVTQVLSELDFAVSPCTEPFAAVKKLMAEHFDAVVVDCDNEQNAILLFKSARNTTTNQSSLAVAVVEGQAGVAKAFRIGANLVLTKPINVEQAKGTLRVARGLLRKSEAGKPATAASVKPSAAVSAPSQEAIRSPFDAAPSSSLIAASSTNVTSSDIAASSADRFETNRNENVSPVIAKPATQPYASEVSAASRNEITASRAGFGNSAASAPSPARDPKANISTEEKRTAVLPQAENTATIREFEKSSSSLESGPAPTFTFGGTLGSSTEPTSGSKKVLFIVAAAVVLIAVASYAAWSHSRQSDDSTVVPDRVAESPVKASAPISHAPIQAPVIKSSTPDTQASGSVENTQYPPSKSTVSSDSSKPSPSSALVNKAPATNEDAVINKAPAAKEGAEPIVIKNGLSRPVTKSVATNNAPAPPSMAAIAPAPGNDGALLNLMDNHSSAPTPVLQTLSVSQGVSQGLLVKKVQPKYPQNALRLRVEGAVQLMATISQNGDISVVKIVSGDPQLAHAAMDAVKQWKYKPYLLNGSPVEIQTQITVNFKLPN